MPQTAKTSKKKASNKNGAGQRARTASSGKRAASPAEKNARRHPARKDVPADPEPLLDDDARRNIAGIVCIVAAVALLLIALVPASGVVSSFLSSFLRLTLGVGVYILPIILAAVGVCFIVRFNEQRVPARVSIGLLLLFVTVLVLLALFTPASPGDGQVPSRLFASDQLQARGGYIGAGIAWVGLTLFGLPVSTVIMVGVIAVALVVIGFSFTKLADAVRAKREEHRAAEDELDVVPAPPYQLQPAPEASKAPVPAARAPQPALDPGETVPQPSVDRTRVIPRAILRRHEEQAEKDEAAAAAKSQKGRGSHAAEDAAGKTIALADRLTGGRKTPDASKTSQLTRKLGEHPKADPAKTAALAPSDVKPASSDAAEEGAFTLPDPSLLKVSKSKRRSRAFEEELADTAGRLQKTLEDFNIMATVVDWVAGPTVTLFEVDLPPGVRVSRVTALCDDIALALAAPGVRIYAPVPGTHYVGIEVPNATRDTVLLGDVLKYVKGGPLEMAIGKDVEGKPVVCDLAKMPHLLIGGTTGSGKSVGINSMIMSMLMRATPDEVRFIMIDPKRVEFTPYNGIPHLYVPVVTEPKEAASALSWGVAEMERRLKVFSKVGARNITQYNDKVRAGSIPDEEAEKLPYIVIIIDELADLMMNVGKEVEFSISRIAQLARAAGIHLIVATQRPSANVVTGLIKANITNRMAFNVASSLDSRVILDTSGAESLIGNGDLLLSKPEYAKPRRIQGCFVSPDEIASVVDFVKQQGEPDYHSEILKTNVITLGDSMPDGSGGSVNADDPLLWEAADIVVASGMGSTSNIQRKLKVGYSRAGRIMDMLEEHGVVGPPNGSKPREVLVDAMELETLKAFELDDERSSKE